MPESVARLAQLESDLAHIERTATILQSYQRECAGPPICPAAESPPGRKSNLLRKRLLNRPRLQGRLYAELNYSLRIGLAFKICGDSSVAGGFHVV
jgi:hypothetical protein